MSAWQRQALLVGVMLVLLIGVAAWAWGILAEARERAGYAAAQTVRARGLADEIAALRGASTATGVEPSEAEFTFVIEGALVDAGIDPAASLRSIRPEATRVAPGGGRDARAPREKRTQLRLEHVTRRELAAFLHAIRERQPAFHVATLQLTAPDRGDLAGGERWTIDPLTVTQYLPAALAQGRDGNTE